MEILEKLENRSPYYEPHEINLEGTVLGSGSFGLVLKGSFTEGNAEIALKLLKKLNGEPIWEFSDEHKKEINILLEAKHKNILKYVGVVKKSIDFYQNGKPFPCYFLIFEYMDNGNVRDYIQIMERSQEKLFEITYGITCGMAYLHEIGIIHRDLAARNILIDTNHQAKIADFGLSKMIDENHDHYTIMENEMSLNCRWVPRECLQIGGKFCKSSDIWSFGVTIWEIWNNAEKPYGDMEKEQIKLAIIQGGNPMSFKMAQGIPEEIVQLLEDIFVEEKFRPFFVDIKLFLKDGTRKTCSRRKQIKNQSSNTISEYIKKFTLNQDNAGNLYSFMLEDTVIQELNCHNISAKLIPEILEKFKGNQTSTLNFWHSWEIVGKCEYFDSSSRMDPNEDCIFKLPQSNPYKNIKELSIVNFEINTEDCNINPLVLPSLKTLCLSLCTIKGRNLIDSIVAGLFLEKIELLGNIPLLKKRDVEMLLEMKSLKFIFLSGICGRGVISGTFTPVGPHGTRFSEINDLDYHEFKRDSNTLPWKQFVNGLARQDSCKIL